MIKYLSDSRVFFWHHVNWGKWPPCVGGGWELTCVRTELRGGVTFFIIIMIKPSAAVARCVSAHTHWILQLMCLRDDLVWSLWSRLHISIRLPLSFTFVPLCASLEVFRVRHAEPRVRRWERCRTRWWLWREERRGEERGRMEGAMKSPVVKRKA